MGLGWGGGGSSKGTRASTGVTTRLAHELAAGSPPAAADGGAEAEALLALLEPDALSGSRDEAAASGAASDAASDAGAHSEAGPVPGAASGSVTDATGDGAPVAGAPPPQGVGSQRNSTL